MGLLKKVGSFVINFSIFFLIITFSPGLPPKTAFPFEEFSVVGPKPMTGPLAMNSRLDNAERLFEGKLDAPENLLVRDDSIYASLRTNEVVKIGNETIELLTSFGESCYTASDDKKVPCGRPLGLAFDTLGEYLIVMHSSQGIFEVDLKNGKKNNLVNGETVIGSKNPRPCKLFNSVAVAKNGDLFFSHSSSEYDINLVALTSFVNPSGRLIHYSRKTGKLKVLLDKLWFANGVALSPAEDFVVVAESHSSRLMRVWLKDDKKGQVDVFYEGLPGAPDNLSYDEYGIWVPIATAADESHPMLPHLMAAYPTARKIVARLFELIRMPFEFISSVYPNKVTNFVCRGFGSMDMIAYIVPGRRSIIRFDWEGNVIRSFHGSDKSSGLITHATKDGAYIIMGSVINGYMSRIKI